MAKIENHKYTVDEAFRECFYVIPDYQREYVWSDKEVLQLLDDIDEQIDTDTTREYFIGMVLVSPTIEKNHYEVIDGQQRLTTLFLLLCALRHRFGGEPQFQTLSGLISTSYTDNAGDIQTNLKLEPRYENAGELMNLLVAMNADPQVTRARVQAADIPRFGSLENLLTAYSTLYRYLNDNYPDAATLRKYWGYLANHVIFIQISTDVSSALKIFETINERGIGLNPMDLLKNLLFTQVQPKEFTKLKNEWKNVTKPLEKRKEKPLRFLRYFLMANYKIEIDRGEQNRNDVVVREDEIYDWFVKKENAAVCSYVSQPFEFVRKIIRNVDQYLAFAEGMGNDGKPSIAMDNLKRLTGGAFSLHYVLLLAAAPLPKALFDHFVRQLESFLFYYIFTKTPTKELERNFSVWADEVRTIVDAVSPHEQTRQLDKFILDRFQVNMAAKDAELTDALNRFTLQTMQQYRTRYFLAKLTQFVDMAYKGLKIAGSLSEYVALEIEHILPNNPKAELRAQFVTENSGADYDSWKIRLGNLTLLEKPINIVAGNDYFAEKKAEYAKSKYYLTSSIAEIKGVGKNSSISRINTKLTSFDEWKTANIEERQSILMGLAREAWKITSTDVS